LTLGDKSKGHTTRRYKLRLNVPARLQRGDRFQIKSGEQG
jgi:hypothetical protein